MPVTVRVQTPERVLIDDTPVDEVVVTGAEGDLGIEADHSPMAGQLGIGSVRLLSGGSTTATASVAGGFFEVRNDQVLVVSPAAELPDEIDVDRAKKARQRAEKRLSSHEELIDKTRATAALMRALNRMKHADDPRL